MSVSFCLMVSDGTAMRAVQPAALPVALVGAIEDHIVASMIERDRSDIPTRAVVTDQVAPVAPIPDRDRVAASQAAKAEGLSGMFCGHCSSARTKQNGTCLICLDCHETTGCS